MYQAIGHNKEPHAKMKAGKLDEWQPVIEGKFQNQQRNHSQQKAGNKRIWKDWSVIKRTYYSCRDPSALTSDDMMAHNYL